MTLVVRYTDGTISVMYHLNLEIAERMAVALFDNDDVRTVVILDCTGQINLQLQKD